MRHTSTIHRIHEHSHGAVGARSAAIALIAAVALSGCYVVPIHGPHQTQSTPTTIAPPPVMPLNFTARLYPSNDLAAPYGAVIATVSNDLSGRGNFSAVIKGETFHGEATRRAGSSRDGVANGTGQRGSFLSCHYSMNNPSQGTGQCRLSDGATFAMHIGH